MSGMKLDVFIEGELVDLCIPTMEYAKKSDWYSWFNDAGLTRYLDQGLWPNNPQKQIDFFLQQKESRLLLIVSDKTDYVGVMSLSEIDMVRRRATLAGLFSEKTNRRMIPYIALETAARITSHGMDVMGLNRIKSGQHINLVGWQQRKELLGYRLEGICKETFVKGREASDTMISAVVYEDYRFLIEKRGQYWDGLENMRARIRKLPKVKYVDRYREFVADEGDKYYKKLFQL